MNRRRQIDLKNGLGIESICCRVVLVSILCFTSGCAQFASWDNVLSSAIVNEDDDVRFGVARRTERNGSLLEAKQLYLQLLAEDANHRAVLHRLGVVSIKLEEIDRALEFFSRAMSQGEPDVALLGDYGYAQFLSGNLEQANQLLSKALENDPNNRRIVNNLALVLGYQGRTAESLALFRRVNTESESLSNLAFVHSQVGDYDKAAEYYHEALDLNPDLRKAGDGLIGLHQFQSNSRKPKEPTLARDEPAGFLVERVEDRLALGLSDQSEEP